MAVSFSFGDNMQLGRQQIFTDYKYIDSSNLLEVLQKAFSVHCQNSAAIDFLLKYEAGEVNPIPEKTARKEIQNFVPDPIASYIVEFKLGFEWGNPITFVQSDDDDKTNDEIDFTKAISLVNQNYRAQRLKTKQQELARYIEIGGVGYTYIDINTEWEDGDSYFTLDVFDPRTTFVVRSTAYTDKRVVLGVSFRIDEVGDRHFTCFTKESRFEVSNMDSIISEDQNPLNKIPIIEYIRSYDRQGCFERLIPMIDSVNQSLSYLLDGMQSNVDTIWFSSDVEFPIKVTENDDGTTTEEVIKPKDGDWLLTNTTRDGKTPQVKPLTVDYDYSGQLENISATRTHIWRLAHVPQRNDNSGGSTGVAMDDAAGWTDAEADACRKQMLTDSAKMNELQVITAVYKVSPNVPEDSPLLKLHFSDCAPSFKRSKEYELTVKTNASCALLSHGFALEDVVANINMFEDPSQVIARSGEGVRRYQEKNVFNSGSKSEESTGLQDISDQQTNSPLIGGMSKQEAVEIE